MRYDETPLGEMLEAEILPRAFIRNGKDAAAIGRALENEMQEHKIPSVSS